MSPDDISRALARPGRASIPYIDRYSRDRPLVLECFRPQGHNPDKPVVIVQHGMSRNGAEYCEAWVPAAERHGLLIVAITFSKESWPDAVTYNNGHVLAEDGSLRPRECWSQAIPRPRLCAIARSGRDAARQDLSVGPFGRRTIRPSALGHAAARHFRGSRSRQFRLAYVADARPSLPRRARRHRADPRECRSSSWLPAGDLFRRPGHRRYDREFSEARSRDGAGAKPVYAGAVLPCPRPGRSAKLGVPCRWSRFVVPGVAHEGMRMSGFAADYWFGAAGG